INKRDFHIIHDEEIQNTVDSTEKGFARMTLNTTLLSDELRGYPISFFRILLISYDDMCVRLSGKLEAFRYVGRTNFVILIRKHALLELTRFENIFKSHNLLSALVLDVFGGRYSPVIFVSIAKDFLHLLHRFSVHGTITSSAHLCCSKSFLSSSG